MSHLTPSAPEPQVVLTDEAMTFLEEKFLEALMPDPVLCIFRGRPEEAEEDKWHLYLRPLEDVPLPCIRLVDGYKIWIISRGYEVDSILVRVKDGHLEVV